MKKRQIFIIHGGMTFKTKKDYLSFLDNLEISLINYPNWKGEYLDKKLGKDFEIIRPRFPLSENANYLDWKIYFEKYLTKLDSNFILLGFSLGGIFLAKYLSENKLLKKPKAVFLIAPPYDNSLPGEDLVGGFKLGKDLSLMESNCQNTYLFFSKDDPVIPLEHVAAYSRKLINSRIILVDKKNGHFRVPKFPELVKMIKNIK